MFTTQQCILMNLLNCGVCDLDLLEDINYDLDDILDYLKENGDLNINSIFREVFIAGALELQEEFDSQKDEIRERILERLQEEKAECIADGMTEEEIEECEEHQQLINDLELLKNAKLKPKDDLDYYLNYQDTHVFMKHIEFYRKWLSKEVDNIEDKMGWKFRNID